MNLSTKTAIACLLLIFVSINIGFTQEIGIDKEYSAKHKKAKSIEKALKSKNYEEIKEIRIDYYTDSIFPNDDILKFKNVEMLIVMGPMQTKKGFPNITKPIKLKVDGKKLALLKNLKYLDLALFDLKVFPKEIFTLTQLKELTLYCNFINQIPPEIGNLKNLEMLVIMFQNIHSLPKEIASLEKLELLELNNNLFTELPLELKDLKSIKKIVIDNNHGAKSYFPFFNQALVAQTNRIKHNTQIERLKQILEIKTLEKLHITGNDKYIKLAIEKKIDSPTLFQKIVFKRW